MVFLSLEAVAQPNFRKHVDTRLGFEVSYPRNWKPNFKNANKAVLFTAAKTENGKPVASLWIHVDPSSIEKSLDSLTFDYMKILRSDRNIIHGGKEVMIDGRKAYSFDTSVENDEQSKRCDFYLLKTDSRFYIIALTVYRSRDYDSYTSDFRQIIESLKIQNP